MPLIIFGGVLVEVIIGRIAVIVHLVGACVIEHLWVSLDRVVVHRRVGSIIHIVIPFVQPDAPGLVAILARQFGREEHLVYLAPVEAGHTALHVSAVRLERTVGLTGLIAGGGILFFHVHRRLVEV